MSYLFNLIIIALIFCFFGAIFIYCGKSKKVEKKQKIPKVYSSLSLSLKLFLNFQKKSSKRKKKNKSKNNKSKRSGKKKSSSKNNRGTNFTLIRVSKFS